MLLDILDDIFLLHLPFESSKSTLDRLAVLDLDFRHADDTPLNSGEPSKCIVLR